MREERGLARHGDGGAVEGQQAEPPPADGRVLALANRPRRQALEDAHGQPRAGVRQGRRGRGGLGRGGHVGCRGRPQVVPGGGKRGLPLQGLGQIVQDRDHGVVEALAEGVVARPAGVEDRAVGQHLAHGAQGRLAEPPTDFLNRLARRDDRHGHESLLSVDPVSWTVTVSTTEAPLFHLLISPPLVYVTEFPGEAGRAPGGLAGLSGGRGRRRDAGPVAALRTHGPPAREPALRGRPGTPPVPPALPPQTRPQADKGGIRCMSPMAAITPITCCCTPAACS